MVETLDDWYYNAQHQDSLVAEEGGGSVHDVATKQHGGSTAQFLPSLYEDEWGRVLSQRVDSSARTDYNVEQPQDQARNRIKKTCLNETLVTEFLNGR